MLNRNPELLVLHANEFNYTGGQNKNNLKKDYQLFGYRDAAYDWRKQRGMHRKEHCPHTETHWSENYADSVCLELVISSQLNESSGQVQSFL